MFFARKTKIALVCLLACLLVCSVAAIVACKPNPDECEHQYQLKGAIAATCTEQGSSVYQCEICNDTQTQTYDALGHALQYDSDQTQHWSRCTRTGCSHTEGATVHAYTTLVSTTPSTCQVAGSKVEQCICGAQQTTTLPLGAHSNQTHKDSANHWQQCTVCNATSDTQPHNPVFVQAVPSTCQTKGYDLLQCSCGYQEHGNEQPLADHYYPNIYQGYEPATCMAPAYYNPRCEYCGTVDRWTDNVFGEHDNVYYEPGEVVDGKTVALYHKQCTVCKKYFATNATGADYQNNQEITGDGIAALFVQPAKVVQVATLEELWLTAIDDCVDVGAVSNNIYKITLTVGILDLDNREVLFVDEANGEWIFSSSDGSVDVTTLQEGDVVTLQGKALFDNDSNGTLVDVEFVQVVSTATGFHLIIHSNGSEHGFVGQIYASIQGDDQTLFAENTQYFNVLNANDVLVFDGVAYNPTGGNTILKSVVINNQAYTMNGTLNYTVTGDVEAYFTFAVMDEDYKRNLTVDVAKVDTTVHAAPAYAIDPYFTCEYNGTANEYGRLYANSNTVFATQNAYVVGLIIQFESGMDVADMQKNVLNAGKAEHNKQAVDYTIDSSKKLTVNFDVADKIAYLQYVANKQARVVSIRIIYNTYNTLTTYDGGFWNE